MNRDVSLVLALLSYAAAFVFYWRIIWHAVILLRTPSPPPRHTKRNPLTCLPAILDIIFLRRLFATNRVLWIGEWLFHVSFVLVILRHLGLFFYWIPGWTISLQRLGIYAEYVLVLSLLYILLVRIMTWRKAYTSMYNMFLTITILLLGITGILLRTVAQFDITLAKQYILGILLFSPVSIPNSGLFQLHFAIALMLLVSLPSHIVGAPFTAVSARSREIETERLMHDG